MKIVSTLMAALLLWACDSKDISTHTEWMPEERPVVSEGQWILEKGKQDVKRYSVRITKEQKPKGVFTVEMEYSIASIDGTCQVGGRTIKAVKTLEEVEKIPGIFTSPFPTTVFLPFEGLRKGSCLESSVQPVRLTLSILDKIIEQDNYEKIANLRGDFRNQFGDALNFGSKFVSSKNSFFTPVYNLESRDIEGFKIECSALLSEASYVPGYDRFESAVELQAWFAADLKNFLPYRFLICNLREEIRGLNTKGHRLDQSHEASHFPVTDDQKLQLIESLQSGYEKHLAGTAQTLRRPECL